eukprot:CAMPEP_0119562606 /NCGR_PEP_ID=MMETSP1352-20130426/20973_1 /TAXON_ID=265584 /ORGANISM="Stauroneis constricta, Strain CCMP1120" /LENGTH=196 /DNA_ID=CAMNT_0007611045 /DNA_START=297 /DNA_END=885 /DNA_ORIENTATION=-
MTTKHMPPSSSSSYSIQTSDIEDDEKGVGSSLPLHAGMRLQYAMPPDAAQTREERDDMTASWYDAIVSKEPIRDPQGAYSLVHLVLLRPVGHDVLYGGAPWKKQAYVARYYGPDDGRWRILSSSGDHDDETISSSPRLAIRPSAQDEFIHQYDEKRTKERTCTACRSAAEKETVLSINASKRACPHVSQSTCAYEI